MWKPLLKVLAALQDIPFLEYIYSISVSCVPMALLVFCLSGFIAGCVMWPGTQCNVQFQSLWEYLFLFQSVFCAFMIGCSREAWSVHPGCCKFSFLGFCYSLSWALSQLTIRGLCLLCAHRCGDVWGSSNAVVEVILKRRGWISGVEQTAETQQQFLER